MEYRLPQFPLELVVFPGEDLPLHIFEARYRTLMHDCQQQDIHFGITPVIEKHLQKFGTEMRLKEIRKVHEDGRMDVVCEALSVYIVESFQKVAADKPYGEALVRANPVTGAADPIMAQKIEVLAERLFTLMRIRDSFLNIRKDPYGLAHKIGFTIEEEVTLLSLTNVQDQQRMVLEKLEGILPRVEELEKIRSKIEMNGHFRYLKPPNI